VSSPTHPRPAAWNRTTQGQNMRSAPMEALLDRGQGQSQSGGSGVVQRRRAHEAAKHPASSLGRTQREVDGLFQTQASGDAAVRRPMVRRGNKIVRYGPWSSDDPRPKSVGDTQFDKMFARGAFLHHHLAAY
jgi:hypothetical protein